MTNFNILANENIKPAVIFVTVDCSFKKLESFFFLHYFYVRSFVLNTCRLYLNVTRSEITKIIFNKFKILIEFIFGSTKYYFMIYVVFFEFFTVCLRVCDSFSLTPKRAHQMNQVLYVYEF